MKNIPQKETRRQPKIKTEMSGKGLTVHAGLLPVLTFMDKLLFRKRVQEAVHKERGANAQYHVVDAVQMVVIGLPACLKCTADRDSRSNLDGADSEGMGG